MKIREKQIFCSVMATAAVFSSFATIASAEDTEIYRFDANNIPASTSTTVNLAE